MSDASKTPTHVAYTTKTVGNGDTEKTVWNRIGAVWAHQDGEGLTVRLDALPLDGEIVIRKKKAEEAADTEGAR
ncbi:MAG: hypothetical protein AAFR73_12050 [Pseudomonadota bacterium]